MTKSKLAVSVRKHIRGEKLRLRRAGVSGADYDKKVAELYKKAEKKSGAVGPDQKRIKTAKVKDKNRQG